MSNGIGRTIAFAFWFLFTAGLLAADSWNGREPVVFQATLPVQRDGAWEPLLAVGVPGAGDVIFCRRLADGRMVFGWEQLGRPAAIADPISLPDSPSTSVLISLGGFLPAENDPLYEKEPVMMLARTSALVQCGGRTVLFAKGEFSPVSGPAVLGRNPVGGNFARPFFSGKITDVATASWSAVLKAAMNPASLIAPDARGDRDAPEFPGPLRLRLSFPGGGGGHNEPLVVTGKTGAGDVVYVRYVDDRHLRIGFDHWLVGGPLSEPLECDVNVPHEVVVSLGSLFAPPAKAPPDSADVAALRHRCVVMLDGRLVLNHESQFHPTTAEQLTLFTNKIGASTANPVFTGTITRVERVSPEEIMRGLPPPSKRVTGP